MRLLLLKHFDFDDPSCIVSWAEERGYGITILTPPDGFRAPSLDSFEPLVILGGPMSAYHEAEHPWLSKEKSFIRAAVESGKKVLGICLGAQRLSEALGGKVYRNEHKNRLASCPADGRRAPVVCGSSQAVLFVSLARRLLRSPGGSGATGSLGSM